MDDETPSVFLRHTSIKSPTRSFRVFNLDWDVGTDLFNETLVTVVYSTVLENVQHDLNDVSP